MTLSVMVKGGGIGRRVRTMRRKRNLTQAELAAKAALSPDTVNKLEGDKTQPHPRTIRKVAAALKVDEEFLTGGVARE
jgi:transcriptional regulator with XRE-family HTH domain